MLAATLGAPMVGTGHSLGRNKLALLLQSSSMRRREIEAEYCISRRIEAEERMLDSAEVVFASTQQEVDEQVGLLPLAPCFALSIRSLFPHAGNDPTPSPPFCNAPSRISAWRSQWGAYDGFDPALERALRTRRHERLVADFLSFWGVGPCGEGLHFE